MNVLFTAPRSPDSFWNSRFWLAATDDWLTCPCSPSRGSRQHFEEAVNTPRYHFCVCTSFDKWLWWLIPSHGYGGIEQEPRTIPRVFHYLFNSCRLTAKRVLWLTRLFVFCFQIHRLRLHLREDERQSRIQDGFKLPVRVSYQQEEGKKLSGVLSFLSCSLWIWYPS